MMRLRGNEGMTALAGCVFSGLALAVALFFTRSGFDFSDEGFYLASIATPGEYVTSLSLFGHAYHLVYVALGGSIFGLRVFNLLLVYLLAFSVAYVVARRLFHLDGRGRRAAIYTAAGIAATSLLIASLQGRWLASPGYNSLALTATLVVALGATLCCSRQSTADDSGWGVMGVGGWLAFLGKPTTAALLALATLALLVACGKVRGKGLLALLAVSLALLVLTAVVISGSVTGFVDRVMLSVALLKLQQSGHDLGGAVQRFARFPTGARALMLYGVAAVLLACIWRLGPKYVRPSLLVLFPVGLAAGVLFQHYGIGNAYAKEAFVQLLLMSCIVAGCMLPVVAYRFQHIAERARERLALSLYFLVLPYVYAFGTNTDYLAQASSAAFFWIIGGLLLMSRFVGAQEFRRLLPAFSLAAGVFMLYLVLIVAEAPYRQTGSLRTAQLPVRIGPQRALVHMGAAEAAFVERVQQTFVSGGMGERQPTIDLTGTSPGILYAAGAQNVGLAWLLGGYRGSQDVAHEVFRHVGCEELAGAWVLTATSSNSISPAVLESFGASLARDFVAAGHWVNPIDGDRQTLYRPRRTIKEASEACLRTRAQRASL